MLDVRPFAALVPDLRGTLLVEGFRVASERFRELLEHVPVQTLLDVRSRLK